MKLKSFAIPLLFMSVALCCDDPELFRNNCRFISKITLYHKDKDPRVITITSETDIGEFCSYFIDSDQIEIKEKIVWDYTVDITGGKIDGRWLYSPDTGTIARLNYQLHPSFRTRNRAGCNAFIRKLSER